MIRYAIIFLVLAVAAGIIGFAGPGGMIANIAQHLFSLLLILFIVTATLSPNGKKPPTQAP